MIILPLPCPFRTPEPAHVGRGQGSPMTCTDDIIGRDNAMPWLMAALITAVAVYSKTLGSYAGALLGGRTSRDAMRAAALLNTRGLTELVVLQAGREAGILTSKLYLNLVTMALLSTALAGPFYSFVTRRSLCRQPHRCDSTRR
ncbi:cation:proton antiporter [Nonomuraea sp. NPDC051941]|uniref:cation:proton antiporter n=1 Tax=Nonomuraea sp. NPDC051941 TaxID=3364373 RepID=UPI0037C5A616